LLNLCTGIRFAAHKVRQIAMAERRQLFPFTDAAPPAPFAKTFDGLVSG